MAGRQAFTLLEMLVVIAILGMLTALSLPYMKGINASNTMQSATRQLLDDIGFARHRAVSGHTTVYMVFVPAFGDAPFWQPPDPGLTDKPRTNLITGQLSSYVFYSKRAIGDQPGQANGKYLTKWFSLPDGIFIPESKFAPASSFVTHPDLTEVYGFQTTNQLPFTTPNGTVRVALPCIAFDYQGRLVGSDGETLLDRDEIIPLAQGSIFYGRTTSGDLDWNPDVRENPPNNSENNFNRVRIDRLTGRARVERQEIK